MSAFVSLKLAEIPDYLHAGSFYQALSNGDDGTDSEIEVPSRCYKPDCFVDDTTDLEQMFRVIVLGIGSNPNSSFAFFV